VRMTDDDLLDQLVGSWRVTGDLRGDPLSQAWTAKRVLGGRFVEVRVTDGTPLIEGESYEAIYFIGVSAEGGFVMHLMDVFGAPYSAIPGIGRREGDDIVFVFGYSSGPWTWRWSLSGRGGEITQTYVEGGEQKRFATKRMERLA
jgi:hypothetical protein